MKLMSASWVPANRPLKALILLLHGYGFDCTTYFQVFVAFISLPSTSRFFPFPSPFSPPPSSFPTPFLSSSPFCSPLRRFSPLAATAERLASEGYGVYGIDFEGHGRSDGLSVFIPDFNTLVDDSIAYFAPIRARVMAMLKRRNGMDVAFFLLSSLIFPFPSSPLLCVYPPSRIALNPPPDPDLP
ncbi:unnamed protein product [Closterium sp. NIES-54]